LATGNLSAVTTVQVGSQVSGTLEEIFVDYNSVVRKGQVIAQIDTRLFEAAVLQTKGNLANARAALDRANVQVIDTERTYRRNRELVKDGFVAQSDVDTAQTAYETALAQKRSAEGQVTQAQGQLSAAETNLRYATIHSPVDGIVISRNVDAGQTVAASFQTPTLFTIAEDLTKMQIDTNVDEADIGKVKTGQRATFTVDAYPERTFDGTVVQVRNSPVVTQNVVTYYVVVRIDNQDLLLKPGMTANVSVHVRDLPDVLKIPNAALRFRPSDEKKTQERKEERKKEGTQRVYVLGKDGKPQEVPVKGGVSDGKHTQLVEGDLKEKDLVVIEEIRKKQGAAGGQSPRMRFF
ncbi:MAG TPA: efflux RND transporter periplasmic adaptor subunit, partial [Candidatus Deferrimicrobiaceae bacterium]|nr:efflux RND transporter periplasmic adaptor subunit [Candidatus Deferrimicrobiaceae bacterium]